MSAPQQHGRASAGPGDGPAAGPASPGWGPPSGAPVPGPAPGGPPAARAPGRAAARPAGARWRQPAAWVLLVLAGLLLPAAVVARWAAVAVADEERYLAAVTPLADDPAVRAALADVVTDALVRQLEAQASGAQWLPESLRDIAGGAAGAARGFVHDQVEAVLASDAAGPVWVALNRQAHRSLLAALAGEAVGPVSLQDGQVVLDTGDLAELVRQRLVDSGVLVAAVLPVPPQADRQVVLLTAPRLEQARAVYAALVPGSWWLVAAVAVLAAAAPLVARRRAPVVAGAGVVVAAGAGAVYAGIAVATWWLGDALAGTVLDGTAPSVVAPLTEGLRQVLAAGLVLGGALLLAGLVGVAVGARRRAGRHR